MKIVLQQSALASPVSVDGVNQLAVYNDQDSLLLITWTREDGTIALTRAGEPDFVKLSEQMGLHKRSDVRCVTVPT
jgi:hypothetical protein